MVMKHHTVKKSNILYPSSSGRLQTNEMIIFASQDLNRHDGMKIDTKAVSNAK